MGILDRIIRFFFKTPNIIRVVDKLDKNPDTDLAFPTEFAKMVAEMRRSEE